MEAESEAMNSTEIEEALPKGGRPSKWVHLHVVVSGACAVLFASVICAAWVAVEHGGTAIVVFGVLVGMLVVACTVLIGLAHWMSQKTERDRVYYDAVKASSIRITNYTDDESLDGETIRKVFSKGTTPEVPSLRGRGDAY